MLALTPRTFSGGVDFPAWCVAGGYGGLVCSLIVAVLLAAFAVHMRRGTPRQLAFAMVLCLLGSILSVVSIWWIGARLNIAGALLSTHEVLFALVWIALWGWCLPLMTLGAYALFTERRAGVGWSRHLPAVRDREASVVPGPSGVSDARRKVASEPNGPWGRLVPLDPRGHPFLLTERRALLGRAATSSVLHTDDRASGDHIEINWDHGRPWVLDKGSMNGTLLNGRPLRGQMLLRHGDVLVIGKQQFRFEVFAQSSADSAPNTSSPPASRPETDAVFEPTAKMKRSGGPAPATVPLQQLALVGIEGAFAGTRCVLRGPVVTIGRDPNCTVSLGDLSVSRVHAQVMIQPGGAYLTDLQSSNGTFYNGQPLTRPQALKPGDVIVFGAVEMRCELARIDDPERISRPGTSQPDTAGQIGPTAPPPLHAPVTQRNIQPPNSGQPHPGSQSTPRMGLPISAFPRRTGQRPPTREN